MPPVLQVAAKMEATVPAVPAVPAVLAVLREITMASSRSTTLDQRELIVWRYNWCFITNIAPSLFFTQFLIQLVVRGSTHHTISGAQFASAWLPL